MSDERWARMEELLALRRYSAALETAVDQLGAIVGLPFGRDDAVSREAVDAALDAGPVRHRNGHAGDTRSPPVSVLQVR